MSYLQLFGDYLARAFRVIRWVALLILVGSLAATVAAEKFGYLTGIAVGIVYLAAVTGVAVWVALRRRQRAASVRRPPLRRFNEHAVLAAVYGPQPISGREMCAAALVCALHLGMTDRQIGRLLDCHSDDVPRLLGVAPARVEA